MNEIATITGQKPVACKSTKDVSNFKLRKGMPIGVRVTLRKERMYEFAFEGLRYWDLLRQGVDVAAAEIAETRTLLSGGVEDVVTIQGSKITATRGLCQIPYNQINLSNGVLKQNAGW